MQSWKLRLASWSRKLMNSWYECLCVQFIALNAISIERCATVCCKSDPLPNSPCAGSD